jgi:hypothetical protein
MERSYKINPKKSVPKGGLKPDFLLFDERVGVPIILPSVTSEGLYNVEQTTLLDPQGNFLKVNSSGNIVSLVQGTAFYVSVQVLDPEDQIDPNNVLNIKFRWYKNGSYLYEVNNLNDFKGVNRIEFSAEQCVPEISGVYSLEVVNSSGVSTAGNLTIRVYDRVNVPELYGNLLQNSSGETGLDSWEVENGVVVSEFRKDVLSSNNFASIQAPRRLTLDDSDQPYTIQPDPSFAFCSATNWVNMGSFYRDYKAGQPIQNDWWFNHQPPNLVINEDPGVSFASFFPAKSFFDEYNENENKAGILSEMKVVETYFTKAPVTKDAPNASMTQTIDVSGLEDFIDGKVCGVNKVVGNFFAYVGLGINSYTYKAVHKGEYRIGPANQYEFNNINGKGNDAYVLAQKYYNTPVLEGGSSSDELRLFILPAGSANYQANGKVFNLTDLVVLKELEPFIQGGEEFFIYTNPNLSGVRRFSYSFPNWKYPILSELFDESITETAGGLSSLGGFARMFGYLFAAKDLVNIENKNVNVSYGPPGPPLYHPDQNVNDTTARNAARAYLSSSITQRFEDAQDYLMNNFIAPLNDTCFGIENFAAPVLGRDLPKYTVLKQLLHAICCKDTSERSVHLSSNSPLSLIKSVFTSTTYEVARARRDSYFGTVDVVNATGDELYDYVRSVIDFYIYEAIRQQPINPFFELITPAAPNTILNTFGLTPEKLKTFPSNTTPEKTNLRDVVDGLSYKVDRIELIPKCNDTVNFTISYIDAFGELLKSETVDGPTVDDIFAVKEKMNLAYYIGILLRRTCHLPNDYVKVTYKEGPTLFEVSATDIRGGAPHEVVENNPNLAQLRERVKETGVLYYDPGAAAFFGIQKKLYIPSGTRSIEVKADLLHESIAVGIEPDTGTDLYDIEEIPAEHTNYPFKFFRSGNPRVGVAHMKLCLYDNEFKRTAKYPHYYMPRYHVWKLMKQSLLNNPIGYLQLGNSPDLSQQAGSWVYNVPNRGTIASYESNAQYINPKQDAKPASAAIPPAGYGQPLEKGPN